ncbi:cytochrome P450 84A1-like [Carica papaya]|uniref:cytochrome P450 84A1-like n=1 Tax=Carica papaya TaxID=3649 RepID=UPI000B8C70A9|nr:cytochrome P450 84A1-like [Carica papaya]
MVQANWKQSTTMVSLQSPQPSSSVLFFLLPLLALVFFLSSFRRKLPYPPGPRGLPIIGNMAMIDQLTHRGLAQLGKKYGGLFHLRMGLLHIIGVSTPEMAREVLQAQDIVFSNRPANVAISYLTYDRADMAFANYGPFWRQMRKICVVKVFSRKRTESWASVREEVDSMVRAVKEKTGSAVNLGEMIFALTRSITYRAAFGSVSKEGQDEFMKILQEFSKLLGALDISDFVPWLGWVHSQEFNKRLVRARSLLDGFIDNIIDEHIEKKKMMVAKGFDEEEGDTDMVDELVAFYSEDAQKGQFDESQFAIKLTRDNIKGIIMDVMFGGTETVASAIEWTLSELIKSPEDLKRVQRELADVVGLNRAVQESDMEKLTFLKCVLKETLRLHPPIPLLLHETSKDSVVSGYKIPSGSRIMINVWAIGRDGSAWVDPDVFRPSRFLEEGAPDFKGSNFQFIPFGSGRRSCPGMQLGLYALDLTVAHLLHCFNWELPDGQKPSELNMDDVFGLTAPRASQLVAVPSYRLSCP